MIICAISSSTDWIFAELNALTRAETYQIIHTHGHIYIILIKWLEIWLFTINIKTGLKWCYLCEISCLHQKRFPSTGLTC